MKPARKRQRRVTGEVGQGQHLVRAAKERAADRPGLKMRAISLATLRRKAIGLNEVDGGEEARLAKSIGPGIGDLRAQLIELVVEGDLLESSGGFGE